VSNLGIADLFQPAPPVPPPGATGNASWLNNIINVGTSLGLATTAWQSGSVVYSILNLQAVLSSYTDSLASVMIQGGFLDFAATGTVTGFDILGNPYTLIVTPDPSIPAQNPTGALGWLDIIAMQVYNTFRNQASAAAGPLYFVNTTGSAEGTFDVGTFTVASESNPSAQYTNTAPFTLAASAAVGGGITSSTAHSGGIVAFGTASAHGLTSGQVVCITGIDGPNVPTNSIGALVNGDFWIVTVIDATDFSINLTVQGLAYEYGAGGQIWIPQSVGFAAAVLGPSNNAAVGDVSVSVTSTVGCFFGNITAFSGAPWESNIALASRCRAYQATTSPDGPSGAYYYFSLQAYSILEANTVAPFNGTTLYTPVTQAVAQSDPYDGSTAVILAGLDGGIEGVQNIAITDVTSGPAQVTTSVAHGLLQGDFVSINAVQGVTGINNTPGNPTWLISSVPSPTTMNLTHVTGGAISLVGSYTSGGQLTGGDILKVQWVLQQNCVPDGVGTSINPAVNVDFTITGTVFVPANYVVPYIAALETLLSTYLSAFQIGGFTNVDASNNVLPISDIQGIFFSAGNINGRLIVQSIYQLAIVGSAMGGPGSLNANGDLVLGQYGVPILTADPIGTGSVSVIGN
jgi:hypothetical protein